MIERTRASDETPRVIRFARRRFACRARSNVSWNVDFASFLRLLQQQRLFMNFAESGGTLGKPVPCAIHVDKSRRSRLTSWF